MVSKTRDKLIEVARQLFAYKGVENTTMNDIAAASDKGRRTIYTYFKNKREIYNAVLERQSNGILDSLRQILDSDATPADKLRRYIAARIDMIVAQPRPRHERYRYFFSRSERRNEKVTRIALQKEREMFDSLVAQGIAAGEFNPDLASRLPSLFGVILTGMEALTVHSPGDDSVPDLTEIKEAVVSYISDSILIK